MKLGHTKFLSLVLRGLGLVVGFASTILLTNILSTEDFGYYTFVYSIMLIFTIPFVSGIPMFVVRQMGRATTDIQIKNIEALSSKLQRSSVFYAISLFFFILLIDYLVNSHQFNSNIYLVLFCIPFCASVSIDAGLMRGRGHIVKGQLVEHFIRPIVFVLFVIIAHYYNVLTLQFSIFVLLVSFILSSVISKLLSFYTKYEMRVEQNTNAKISKDTLSSITLMTFIGGLNTLFANVDIIILGIYDLQYDIGLYKVAFQLSMLVVFAQTVINQVVQRKIAKEYALNNVKNLQGILINASKYIFLISFLIAFVILFYNESILKMGFGIAYEAASPILLILTIAQLINVTSGCNGLFLNNVGYEKVTCFILAISVIANVLLTFYLVPAYGAIGAAVGSLVSTLIWNLMLLLIVLLQFKIHSSWALYSVYKVITLIKAKDQK